MPKICDAHPIFTPRFWQNLHTPPSFLVQEFQSPKDVISDDYTTTIRVKNDDLVEKTLLLSHSKRPIKHKNDVDLTLTRPRYYTYVFIFYKGDPPFCLTLCLVVFTKVSKLKKTSKTDPPFKSDFQITTPPTHTHTRYCPHHPPA